MEGQKGTSALKEGRVRLAGTKNMPSAAIFCFRKRRDDDHFSCRGRLIGMYRGNGFPCYSALGDVNEAGALLLLLGAF